MWWYNILGDNDGIISHILRLDTITEGSILLNVKIVALKRENYEPILTVKIIDWRKSIDWSGLSIEDNPYRVVKTNLCFSYIVY